MKGNKLIVTSIILGTLGLAGWILAHVLKTDEQKDDRKKTSKKKEREKTPHAPEITEEIIKKIETKPVEVPEVIASETYTSARDLLKDVLFYLMKRETFFTPEELLEKAIKICGQKIDDYSWYEILPKNVEEMENFIKEFDYYVIYQISLGNEEPTTE